MRPLEEILAMWEELTAAMRAAYKPYNLQLFELLGRCCGGCPRCLKCTRFFLKCTPYCNLRLSPCMRLCDSVSPLDVPRLCRSYPWD